MRVEFFLHIHYGRAPGAPKMQKSSWKLTEVEHRIVAVQLHKLTDHLFEALYVAAKEIL